jgi:L,D-transpeptidase-like protein
MSLRLALIAVSALFGASLAAPASASILITVNKSSQQMTVEVDGNLRWTWPVSTGQLGYDTPAGRYTAFRMEADHFSKEWDDAPMPHSIFFTQKGHAIHGYLNTSRIGQPASHGCVRLAPDNATKLYALVEEQGLPNTKVVVTGDVRVALGGRGLRSRDGYDTGAQFTGAQVNGAQVNGPQVNGGTYGYAPGYAPRYDYRAQPYGYGYGYGNGNYRAPQGYGYYAPYRPY